MTDAEPSVDQLNDVITDNPDADAVAAAAAADEAAAATSAGGGEDEKKVIWPENWREEMAGGDEKKLTRLGRFDQPGRVLDSYLELEQKHSSADIRSPFPDKGSDDDKATWRESNNVPAEAGGYFDGLPDGITVSEEDRAGMDTLAEAMHAVNASPVQTHAAMGAYYSVVENLKDVRAELDVTAKRDTDDDLDELYGTAGRRRNINDLSSWIGTAGDEVKADILGARTPDGTPLGSNSDFLKWMIGQMRALNPLVTVPGLGAGDPALAINDEIAEIEKVIANDGKAYRADKKMNARYLTLIEARDKNK